ncbi:MAG TPA: flagellar FlbD family protein [Pseudacidobacterium sp.]|jgi:flagellar protein FlbD|nr:flagellar FlbD family protein [Pseudacidobacterium sp.]
MIELTRLNGNPMVVNSDLLKYVESSPDTTLTLINGEKIVVSEPCEEVVRRVTAYRARLLADVLAQASSDGLNALATTAANASGLRVVAAKNNNDMPETDVATQQRRRRREQ